MTSEMRKAKQNGILAQAICYLFATAAAVAAGWTAPWDHPLAVAALADAVGTVVVFGFSRALDNSSLYDPYWSVAPPLLALYFWWHPPEPVAVRALLAVGLTWVWGIRLTFNFLRGWKGLQHEDWRYVDLREQHGKRYWLVSFAGVHAFPTVLVFTGCLALYAALARGQAPLGWLDGLATAVTALGIWLEATADRQLRDFALTNDQPGKTLDTGLWARSRHPNYLGENLFWWGLALFGIAAAPGAWWVFAGPAAMAALFLGISIPMIERRMHARREDYAGYCNEVPVLVPLPGRRRRG